MRVGKSEIHIVWIAIVRLLTLLCHILGDTMVQRLFPTIGKYFNTYCCHSLIYASLQGRGSQGLKLEAQSMTAYTQHRFIVRSQYSMSVEFMLTEGDMMSLPVGGTI
ncbi:hypothetical protein DFJ58DRAFT_792934 [Suillus subalutaceus]|uniref:uncharacterized protein n=1 Tax=Suillus subalutaceus TaxID=48586 RepID=UPI001B884008|nr:uncharacterized protein DFJ58DRAFT_792934 [Suillus subalutaceus]KAG1851065.1 hypothetical protein DFJ58DRAFT_792934 [Suillus subalutaceus]